jgi:hypothetical protein
MLHIVSSQFRTKPQEDSFLQFPWFAVLVVLVCRIVLLAGKPDANDTIPYRRRHGNCIGNEVSRYAEKATQSPGVRFGRHLNGIELMFALLI